MTLALDPEHKALTLVGMSLINIAVVDRLFVK